MDFDTKIKIVLREDLEPWQELNVTAFLMSGIAGTQNIIGDPYKDKNGVQYLPMSQQPIMIHTASKEALKMLLQKAKEGLMASGEAMRALKPVVGAMHEKIKEAQSNDE